MYNFDNPDIDFNCVFIVTSQVLTSLWKCTYVTWELFHGDVLTEVKDCKK